MVAPTTDRCPQCGAVATAEDFQCPQCELLLNFEPQAVSREIKTEPSIVRALLAPPERRPTGDIPAVPSPRARDDGPTARYTVPMDEQTYPRLRGGVELASRLHDFEAYVVSFVDGMSNVPTVAKASHLSEIEVHVVLKSLLEHGVVELHREPLAPGASVLDEEPTTDHGWYEDVRLSAEHPRPLGLTPPPPPPPEPPPLPAPKAPPPVTPSRGLARPVAPMAPLQKVTGAGPPRKEALDPAPAPAGRPENAIERAVALERRGEIDGAIHVLRRAIAGVHHPGPLFNKLALILVHQRKDFRQAEELLRKAMALEPENRIYEQNLFKVLALAASGGGSGGKESKSGGFLSKLIRGKN